MDSPESVTINRIIDIDELGNFVIQRRKRLKSGSTKMPIMEKLRMFVAQEPVVAASCLIGGVGLFLPAVVRPILDSLEASKQVKAPPLTDVIAGVTGKKQS